MHLPGILSLSVSLSPARARSLSLSLSLPPSLPPSLPRSRAISLSLPRALSLCVSHTHSLTHILALSLGSDVSPASSRRDGSGVGVTTHSNTGARTHTPQLRNTHTPHHRGVGVHPHTPAPEPKFLHQSKACSPAPPRRDGRGDPSPRSKCIYQEYFRSPYLSLPGFLRVACTVTAGWSR